MRRFLIFSIVLVISLTALSTSRALIISVFQFKSSDITPLNYAENDAKRFKEALIFLDLVPEENIKFLENPTLAEMRVAIREFFSEAKSGDVLYFFYSGHGYYDEKSSRTYLIPWDVDPAYLRETAYPVEDSLKDLLLRSGIKVFMFIDACYSGSIGKDKPLRFRHFSEESLKEIVSRSNVGLLLSSDEDEVSKEDEELEGGVFTYYLVRGMKGEANLDGDERITLEELARYVRDKVSERTHGAQHPQVIASAGIEGEVVAEDYTKIELKALERLRNLSGIPDEVKGVVGKIVMQTPEKDTEIERKVRRYIRRYGLGEIGSDILVDLIEANLDKLRAGGGYQKESEKGSIRSSGSDVINSLLKKGKIGEIVKVIKETHAISEHEERDILRFIKDFDEESLRDMRCETEGGQLLREYGLRYIEEVKKAVSSMDAEKTSELLNEIRPNVAKELLRDEKPWAWAFKRAFEEDNLQFKGLSELLLKNGKLQGANVETALPPRLGWLFSYPPYVHFGGFSLLLTPSLLYWKLFTISIAYLRITDDPFPLYVDLGLGVAEALSTESGFYAGYLPIELTLSKPMVSQSGNLLNSITAFYLRVGTLMIPGSKVIKVQAGISVKGLDFGAGIGITPEGSLPFFHVGIDFIVETRKTGVSVEE